MAAEAADGGPSPPLPRAGEAAEAPAQAPEKRAAAGRGDDDEQQQQGGEDRPEPKRRRARARITALESVPRAAEVAAAAAAAAAEAASRDDEPEPAGGWDEGGGESFSFHARGFSSAQTTPKFGSFNPGAAAELVAFHLMKASRRRADPQVTEETGDHRTAAGSDAAAAAEGSDGNSR